MTHLKQDPRHGVGWRARGLAFGALGLLMLGVGGAPALAQEAASAKAQLGQANVAGGVQIEMSRLSTVGAAANLPPPHPRGSLNDDQYRIAKARAARAMQAPGGEVGAAPAPPAAPAPSDPGVVPSSHNPSSGDSQGVAIPAPASGAGPMSAEGNPESSPNPSSAAESKRGLIGSLLNFRTHGTDQ